MQSFHFSRCYAKAGLMVSDINTYKNQFRPLDQMRSTPPTKRKVWFDIHANHLSDRDYWSCLSILWTTDYLSHDRGWWHNHMWCSRPHRAAAMTPVERAVYEQLDSPIILHRGYAASENTLGISWTDDLSVAEFFAYRFLSHQPEYNPSTAGVITCVFDPNDIALFKNENGEREFIVSEPAVATRITKQIRA
jgi:hypothetical protein|tara:strand:+ start:159 stop:734 length:576 start_codon:yes stop_codon:yes gene_type:complete